MKKLKNLFVMILVIATIMMNVFLWTKHRGMSCSQQHIYMLHPWNQ